MSEMWLAPAFDPPYDPVQLARCGECELVCALGVTEQTLTAAYDDEYYGSPEKKFLGAIEGILSSLVRRRVEKLMRHCSDGKAGTPRVLDIGCGRGLLLEAFKEMGAIVTGLERQEFPGRPGYIQISELGDSRFSGEVFDLIILWHALEHLPSMKLMLDEICDHLNEGGVVAIALPGFSSWQSRLFGRHWFHLDLPRHLLHVSNAQLIQALRQRGMDIIGVSHFDLLQNVFGFIQSALNVLLPRRANNFYRLLKSSGRSRALSLFGWMILAVPILPFAMIEYLLAGVAGRGATVQVFARKSMSSLS